MREIDEKFAPLIDRLTFMELKKDIGDPENGVFIKKSVPLPMLQDSLTKGILAGDFDEEISYKAFLEGIFFYLGISEDLENTEDYKTIINLNKAFSLNFASGMALKYTESERLDYATVIFRGIKAIEPSFLDACYNLGLCYEKYALKNKDNKDTFDMYFKAALLEMEDIINQDDKYYQAYYKLGYYHRYRGEFLLARVYWEKYLELSDDEILKEEVRNERLAIYDDSLLEGAMRFIQNKKYSDALQLLEGIGQKSQIVEYYFAKCYQSMGDNENAVLHYEKAISIDMTNSALYNDLATLYYMEGNLEAARAVYTRGIENARPDYKLYFNRGLTELHLGFVPESFDDIKMAHDMNPDDVEVLKQYNVLEKYMRENGGQ